MIQRTYRDALEALCPGWLQGTWALRVMYSIGVHFDLIVELCVRAVWLRFPRSNACLGALTAIGRDRGIVRGFDESDASYAERCSRWIADRRRRGGPYALLRQIQGYLTGHEVSLRVVTQKGHWYQVAADGTESWASDIGDAQWNWDASLYDGSEYFVVISVPSTLWSIQTTWDVNEHGTVIPWGDTTHGVLGLTATRAQVDTLKMLVREWGAPHAVCLWIVLAFDAGSFVPGATDSATAGNWGNWGIDIATGKIAARSPTARYISGRQTVRAPHGV